MTDKLPWMPFYGTLFYEDESVALMEPAEEAIYLRLLWRQWREGSLPADHGDLERLARGTVSARVLELLPIGPDGRRRNPHMEEKRAKHQETQEKYAARGRKARAKQTQTRQEAGNKPATSQPEAQEVRSKNEDIEKEDSSVRPLRASAGRRTTDTPANPPYEPKGGWPGEFAKLYEPIGLLPPGQIGRALKPVVERYGLDRTREMWGYYIRHAPSLRFGVLEPGHRDTSRMSPADFVKTAGTWYAKTQPIGGPDAVAAS